MVVFLFVIMLLNLGQSPPADIRGIGWKLAAGAVGLAIVADVLAVTRAKTPAMLTLPAGFEANQIATTGAVAPIALPLFNQYLLAFEITSVLLLAAIVGAVVVGRQRGEDLAR